MIKYRFPKKNDKALLSFLHDHDRTIDDVKKLEIVSKPNTEELECHKNVKKYVDEYGGEQLIGSYILVNTEDDSLFVIRHSVWKNEDDKILDITPFDDNRPFNIFIDVDIMMKEMCYI